MLRIYGIVKSRAMRVLWLVEELAVPYEWIAVDYRSGGTRQPEFLAINPLGHIPAIDDDGLLLSESMAINLYLVRRHPQAEVSPKGLVEEGRCLNWTLFAVNELESSALAILAHGKTLPPERRDANRLGRARGAVRPPLAVLEQALAGSNPLSAIRGQAQDWLLGDRFTVADINVAAIVEWIRAQPDVFDEFPRVAGWLDRCHQRPAFARLRAMRRAES